MMKKLTSLLLSVVMLVSLLACGASAKTLSAKTLRIAGLKGPTTMGLVHLLSMEKNGTAAMDYDLQLYGAADEIVPKLIKGHPGQPGGNPLPEDQRRHPGAGRQHAGRAVCGGKG